ncbi:glycosyltransferase family 34 protein [Myriangium duriaei CBS 260.36]|uniref:Glycosyltransferase family 34 protein n=1 Tax=Myriangium duriaei CBS 260.36 TaxID=1168546 RepID=A0A9P4IWT2_9PEZI|nr:glycosyltransferase family 34 protein [Myriangium duriaei CBS 260.36]
MPANWPSGGRGLTIAACVILICIVFLFTPSTRLDTRPPQLAPSEQLLQYEPKQGPPSHAAEIQPTPVTSSHPKCSVTKVSMLYGGHKFSQLEDALAGHRRHGERWGCGFEELEYDVTTRKLYSKHYFLMSIMIRELAKPVNQRQQWLMWVDADSILVNPALSPEIFLPPDHPDVYALVTGDHNGLNDGIFYLRVHPSSLDLLTQTAAYPLAHPDEDLGWFGEQAAMANVIKSFEAQSKISGSPSGIAWLPRMWFNAYEFEHGFEGQPGHMLVHFAGLAETRLSHMQK